jgi:hypothetical protein
MNPVTYIQIAFLGLVVARVNGDGGMGKVALSVAADESILMGMGTGRIESGCARPCPAMKPYQSRRRSHCARREVLSAHHDC